MLSQARFSMLFLGLSSACQKVYAAVPIAESWSANRIISEMRRNGVSLDYKVAVGCLDTLLRTSLIREPSRGEFRREVIRKVEPQPSTPPEEKPMKTSTPATPVAPAAPVAPATSTKQIAPMDKLGALAARATTMVGMLKQLADDIADTAVDIQHQIEANEHDMAAFKQLKSIFKNMGNLE